MQQPSVTLHSKLQGASRSLLIVLTNNTRHISLVRVDSQLAPGTWVRFPPEKIQPKTASEFAAQSSGFLQGVAGRLRFSAAGLNEEEDLAFEFSNPYFGSESCSWKSNLGNNASNFKVNLVSGMETTSSGGYLFKILIEVTTKTTITPIRQTLDQQKTQVDPKDLRSLGWKNTLKDTSRSVLVTVHNSLDKPLIRKEHNLHSGRWAHLPAETIEPHTQEAFATAANSVFTGTEGYVVYEISGDPKSSFKFWWENPLLGFPDFKFSCPPNRGVDLNGKPLNHASVEFFVVNKKHGSGGDRPSSIIGSATPKTGESLLSNPFASLTSSLFGSNKGKAPQTRTVTFENRTLRILSFSVELSIPIVSKDPEARAQKLVQWLEKAPSYDVVCLQDFIYIKARDILLEKFKQHFPYVAQTTPNFGLVIFSRFPIMWNYFHEFPVTQGYSEFFSNKGVLIAKVEIQSTDDTASYAYIFNLGLQHDPPELIWRNISDNHYQAAGIRRDQIGAVGEIVKSVLSVEPTPGQTSVIACGNFAFAAETEVFVLSNEQIEKGYLAPLAHRLNEGMWKPTYAWQISALFKTDNISFRHLAALRERVEHPRLKMLVLTEMLSVALAGKNVVQGQVLQRRETCGQEKLPFDEEGEFNAFVLGQLNRVLGNNPLFWEKQVKAALLKRFPEALSSKEQRETYDLRRSCLSVFQLFQSIKWRRSIEIAPGVEERIFTNIQRSGTAQLTPKDILSFGFFTLDKPDPHSYAVIKENLWTQLGRKLNDSNHPTPEYVATMQALHKTVKCWPVDVYRLKNPDSGYTHELHEKQTDLPIAKQRADLILTFDSINGTKVLPLAPTRAAVLPLLSPSERVSWHSAIEASFDIKPPFSANNNANKNNNSTGTVPKAKMAHTQVEIDSMLFTSLDRVK